MTKVTLDMDTFKALASDTRLDILRTLDGKKMSLKDISAATKLNKATLHEHLVKLNEAGLVKRKEREGHKWVTYKLTWKGESLLHPENTRIVVMFSITFIALWAGVIQLLWYVKGTMAAVGSNDYFAYQSKESSGGDGIAPDGMDPIADESLRILGNGLNEEAATFFQDPLFLYLAIACFIVFTVVVCVATWRVWKNKTPKL
jgi:DNA-binding transcriptional ArsR family regulator